MRTFLIAAILTATLPLPAFADIYQCDRLYTNRPCEDGERVLDEVPFTPRPADEVARAERRSMFTDLDLARVKAQREYGVTVDVSAARAACLSSPSESVAACRDAVAAAHSELSRLVIAARGSARDREQKPQRGGDNATAVSITHQEQRIIIIDPEVPPPAASPVPPALPPLNERRVKRGQPVERKGQRGTAPRIAP